MPRRLAGFVASVCALGLVIAGCGGGDGGTASLGDRPSTSSASSAPAATAAPNQSHIATVKPTLNEVQVYDEPTSTQPSREFENPWLYDPEVPASAVPQVFLVKETKGDWVQVLLPVRPNGSMGWVRITDVTLTPNPYRIEVSLGEHTITVYKGADVIYSGPVAVGATDPPLPHVGHPTPTPIGEYYLRILLQAPDPNTVYGPFAYGLSSHSETLEEFAGGDAEIGIHGNNDPSLLGTNATHGCIRMDNAAITTLSKQLPLGTPVIVEA